MHNNLDPVSLLHNNLDPVSLLLHNNLDPVSLLQRPPSCTPSVRVCVLPAAGAGHHRLLRLPPLEVGGLLRLHTPQHGAQSHVPRLGLAMGHLRTRAAQLNVRHLTYRPTALLQHNVQPPAPLQKRPICLLCSVVGSRADETACENSFDPARDLTVASQPDAAGASAGPGPMV